MYTCSILYLCSEVLCETPYHYSHSFPMLWKGRTEHRSTGTVSMDLTLDCPGVRGLDEGTCLYVGVDERFQHPMVGD